MTAPLMSQTPYVVMPMTDLSKMLTVPDPAEARSRDIRRQWLPIEREKNAGSKCIIEMKDKITTIKNPANGDTKNFAYDYSYWSHDGFTENTEGIYEPNPGTTKYADQSCLFRDLGQGVLDNAWQGYNSALFAYGQTGSGKSYSMIGYGANKGIVPITCEELFKAIEGNTDEKQQPRVSFSMLEIYNEQVRDLLVKEKPPHGGLKIRQNPKIGFYVEGLKSVPVRNYKEIEKLMESGTINRTTASTNMNATSSRSHMVITIRFEQVFVDPGGQSNTRSSDINLVDLAGSERADSTGATGDRLKEGSAINQSLSSLGNVISALADIAMGKKKVLVPYRDSVLTKLLQSALGGNSRTIMIAALSPAAINFDETLSTLRYADRAKKIQNKAVVNESPTDRLIRELKEENARLMEVLKKQSGGDTSGQSMTDEDIQRMLDENQKKMLDMQMSWEQRLEHARQEWERSQHTEHLDINLDWTLYPYITNVNEDPQLSGVIKHTFKGDSTLIGRPGSGNANVEIRGLGIQPKHVEVHTDGIKTFLVPCSQGCTVFVNGLKIKDKTQIRHMDRLKLGSNSLFQYVGYPEERSTSGDRPYDFDYFMTELAEHEGVSVDISTSRHEDDQSYANKVLFQEFVDIMPKIAEANAISDELKRYTKFEPVVKSAASHDPVGTATEKEVIIKVSNTMSKKVWIWSKQKFYNRKDLMDELYLKSLDGESTIVVRDKDPFWDPVEDIFLGSCHIMLQTISYSVEVDEHFTIHNYHGKEEAVIHVSILPCNERGDVLQDNIVLEPADLLGKILNIKFLLTECMSIRWINEDASRGVECRFTMPFKKPAKTKPMWHKGFVDFEYKEQYKYKPLTKEILDYLYKNSLVLELWGKQVGEEEQLHSSSNIRPDFGRKKSIDIRQNTPRRRSRSNSIKPEASESLGTEVDVLTQLKHRTELSIANISRREIELESARLECDQMRRENFELKQKLLKAEDKVKLMELRTNMKRKDNKDRKTSQSAMEAPTPPPSGLDVEFAKALREFFRDVREVQGGLKDIKDFVATSKEAVAVNGLKKSYDSHESKVLATDQQLEKCVTELKKNAAVALRKGRPSTEK